MTKPMIEIHFLNGRITRIPDTVLQSVFGVAVQDEIDIRFDDLSDGLYIEGRRHIPNSDIPNDEEHQGKPCVMVRDCYVQILSKNELENVSVVYYEGAPQLVRVFDTLVNLTRVQTIYHAYLDDKVNEKIYDMLDDVTDLIIKLKCVEQGYDYSGLPEAHQNALRNEALGELQVDVAAYDAITKLEALVGDAHFSKVTSSEYDRKKDSIERSLIDPFDIISG